MVKAKTGSNVQVDTRLSYLWKLSEYAPQFGVRLLRLSKKSQRRLTPAVKRRLCSCGRRLNNWEIKEKFVIGTCHTCLDIRILNRYLKSGIDLKDELLNPITDIIREKNNIKSNKNLTRKSSNNINKNNTNNSENFSNNLIDSSTPSKNEKQNKKQVDNSSKKIKNLNSKKNSNMSRSSRLLNEILIKASNSVKLENEKKISNSPNSQQ